MPSSHSKNLNNTIPTQYSLPQNSWILIAILSALMAFTSFSVDIYLPALPQMAKDLHGNVELTITSFLIGFSIAQLVWGPISDNIGRKKPLFIGMMLFIIGSIGCALSSTLTQIIFWRVIQAFGACTGPMLARAMIRDLYTRIQVAQTLSLLTMIMAIAPIIGPLIGGQFVKFSTWHNIFWLLATIGICMSATLYFLPESLPVEKRQKVSIKLAFSNYIRLLSTWAFMRYTLCVTFFYVAAFTFLVGSPFVYIDYYGVAPENYGWIFALNITGVMVLNGVNRQLVKHFSLDVLLKVSSFIAMSSLLGLSLLFQFKLGSMYSLIVLVFLFQSMNGIIAASSIAAALDGVPEIAGAASALIGSLQYGSGIISSLLMACFSSKTPVPMISIMTIFAILSALMVFIPYKKHQIED